MSGSSLDGVDIAYCILTENQNKWDFKIEKATTIEYSKEWRYKLKESMFKNFKQLEILDISYGEFLGHLCKKFINEQNILPSLIASHGHTVFHKPDKKITLQIGNGKKIAQITNVATVYDFRSLDVKLGGQGAPLVPVGDQLLFKNYDFCLNLGGFTNISFHKNDNRIAFDICPCNILLNQICEEIGVEYDKNGNLGKTGMIYTELLLDLNQLKFYQQKPPKSLGKEFVLNKIQPLLKKFNLPVVDKLRTVYEHIALQITSIIEHEIGDNVLITGGGAYNTFLLDLIRQKTTKKLEIPSKEIINYKEALIFGFLGILKFRGENNCLASVTGASRDCSGGILVYP